MKFDSTLVKGKLIKRYKRFLADVVLDDGKRVTAHCTNSGSMISCIEEGAPVYLSPAKNPERKTPYSWEMIHINDQWVGVNTMIPNQLVYEAVKQQLLDEIRGYTIVKREVTFEDSRLDIYAENSDSQCFIEVKNVTMKVGNAALFPDAVTSRGLKHLNTLIRVKEKGMRAIMVYIIQRMDVVCFGTANHIDPNYAMTLQKAIESGVEVYPYQAKVSPDEIVIHRLLKTNF